jgi:hypothetical protein
MPEAHVSADRRPRALRGLVLVFALSFLSLVGVLLTVTALGGLGDWTRWQFIGLFAVLECAAGAANVILPNIWRLPVAEAQVKRASIKLAPSVVLIPHWAAAARIAAGLVLLGGAFAMEGLAPGSFLVLPFAALLAWLITAASLLVARAGVAWPQQDVVQFLIVRPRSRIELPPISIGASALQFLLSIATVPVVKLLPPSVLYQAHVQPSWTALAVAMAVSLMALGAVVAAWQGRIDWHAPPAQRREAERYA